MTLICSSVHCEAVHVSACVQYLTLSRALCYDRDCLVSIAAFQLKSHAHTADSFDAFVPVEIFPFCNCWSSKVDLKLLLCIVKHDFICSKRQIDLMPRFGRRVVELVIHTLCHSLLNRGLFCAQTHEAFVVFAQRHRFAKTFPNALILDSIDLECL